MARSHRSNTGQRDPAPAAELGVVPLTPWDALQLTRSMLASQEQLLDLAAIAVETARTGVRQLQTQLDYLAALAECRDLPSLMEANLAFVERLAREADGGLAQMARFGGGGAAEFDKLVRWPAPPSSAN